MRAVRRLIAVALVVGIVGGCELVERELGPSSVTITAEAAAGAAMSIGGTSVEARVEALGIPAGTWRVDGGEQVLPPGEYVLEVWTVHYSDDIGCEVDATASGGMRCHRDSHNVATCRTDIHVPPASAVSYRYTRDASDGCTLEAS